jgi:ADP-ribose pyrophosphatase YjhB (NUDIX family)
LLELGETIIQGVVRELLEETGLKVQVIELIEVFERIFPSPPQEGAATVGVPAAAEDPRPLYHFVILDYLCEAPEGKPRAGGDVTDVAFGTEEELEQFRLTPAATRVLRKAFELARARAAR